MVRDPKLARLLRIFLTRIHAGAPGVVVVHGHTPAAVPEIVGNRVNLDTGAWQSGILTALAVDGQDKRIMQVEG